MNTSTIDIDQTSAPLSAEAIRQITPGGDR
jgi:hypothetical protein